MVFIARQSPPAELRLIRAGHRTFTGAAEILGDPQARERIGEYLTDMAAAYHREITADLLGQSYGEMAQTLIDSTVSPDEPVPRSGRASR